jgi:lysyl endopeptidase
MLTFQCGAMVLRPTSLEDSNTSVRSATPADPDSLAFGDNVESGTAPWTVTGSWSQVTTQANSPTHSWFVPDPDVVSDATLTTTAAIAVPADAGTVLEFYIRYATEPNYDGTRLEYSLNGGTTWSDILAAQGTVPANAARFISGGYNGVMNASGSFPSGVAWHGAFNTAWIRSSVNMADFAGRNVHFRFHFKSNSSVPGTGFFVDDIRLFYGTACMLDDPNLVFLNGFE